MRQALIETLKKELETTLRDYLRTEGMELMIAMNDNIPGGDFYITLEAIEALPLRNSSLLSEIRIILGVLGKPWQSDALVRGIYYALQPHHLSLGELTVILMGLHVETVRHMRPQRFIKRAVLRYIVEEITS